MPVQPRYRIGVTGALVALSLSTLSVLAPAGADQIEDKRAEAAALADRLSDQAKRIVALDAEWRRATDRLEDLQASVAQAEMGLAAATTRQNALKKRMVVQAQDAYVGGGSISVLRYLVNTDEGDQVARRAYLRIVTGQDRKLIGDLRAVKEDLVDLGRRLDASKRKARAQAGALAEDRAGLDAANRAQRANLASVNGEVASLVAAEQARRDAEAARQAAARDAAAAATAGAATRVSPLAATAPVSTTPGQILLVAPSLADAFACIRQLESGGNYASPGGGAYQFLDSTWHSLGYVGTASDAPPAAQDEAAVTLQARSGWSQWATAPLCGRR